jgi:hypothetical protein
LEQILKKTAPMHIPCELSIADAFQAAVHFLRTEDELFFPGKTYGFLERPQGITAPLRVPAGALFEAARQLDLTAFLPPKIRVGQKYIGAADFAAAALTLLCGKDKNGEVTLTPRPQQMNLDGHPQLRDFTLKGTWRHSDAFEDRYLSERLRLQAWTIRGVN